MPEALEARTSVSHRHIIIGSICLAYIIFRYWGLTSQCLWFDEIFSIHAAEHSWGDMLWFVAQDLIHPPLFYALLKGWISIGGENLGWLRLFSVLFTALTLLPFLQLCREFKFGFLTTSVALVLLAANGSLIKYAQEVRMYGLLLFLATLSIWLFARFYYRGKNIWILTVVNILLVYTHYFGWLVLLSEALVIVIFQRIKFRHLLTMLGIAFASYIPWGWALWKASLTGSTASQNIGWIERPDILSLFNLVYDIIEPFYYQQSSADPTTLIYVSLPVLAVFAISMMIYLANFTEIEDKSSFYLLTIFVAFPVIVAFICSWLLPYSVWGSRHLIIIFVPATLLAAKCLSESKPRILSISLLSIIAVLLVAAFAIRVRTEQVEQVWCGWERLAAEVENAGAGPKTVLTFEDLAAYHLWFGDRNVGRLRIRVVKGIEGLPDDTAYFLPRGFDDVQRINEADVSGDNFWIMFRSAKLDPLVPPISTFEDRGYHAGLKFEVTSGQGKTYAIEMKRAQ